MSAWVDQGNPPELAHTASWSSASTGTVELVPVSGSGSTCLVEPEPLTDSSWPAGAKILDPLHQGVDGAPDRALVRPSAPVGLPSRGCLCAWRGSSGVRTLLAGSIGPV